MLFFVFKWGVVTNCNKEIVPEVEAFVTDCSVLAFFKGGGWKVISSIVKSRIFRITIKYKHYKTNKLGFGGP